MPAQAPVRRRTGARSSRARPLRLSRLFWHLVPLELRLMVATASVVILMVTGGASVIQAAGAPAAPTPAMNAAHAHQALSGDVLAETIPADQSCHVPDPTRRMLTPQEIAHPVFYGERLGRGDTPHRCAVSGLTAPAAPVRVAQRPGQVIVVSTSRQWLWAYQDGRLVFATPVTTGMPHLRTPHGTFAIHYKERDVMFYSPWPQGSPYYYTPEHINYALNFRAGGFYIHDAPWRQAFGPGTQDPHTDPDGTHESGSHGCVNVTTAAARWLYGWVHVGATVTIV